MQIYYSQDIREEELKNQVATDWFSDFDCNKIVGNIDFCVTQKFGHTPPAPIERVTTQDPNFVITLVRNNDTAGEPPASRVTPCPPLRNNEIT